MNYRFIALEGLDGSGKSTQTELLLKALRQQEQPYEFVHFPRSGTGVYGKLIARFLRGDFGALEAVHPQLVALLFAQERADFAPQMRQWFSEGKIVIVDRYVYSNIAFQCAKLTDTDEKNELKKWILELEYEHNAIPKPDLTFYLDAPQAFTGRVLQERMQQRDRAYLEGKDDIHENNKALQQQVKTEYEKLVREQEDLIVVPCSEDGVSMSDANRIHQHIMSCLI